MADDETAITERLRKLAEKAGEEPGGATIVLDEMDLMATTEFKRFSKPAKPATETDDESE